MQIDFSTLVLGPCEDAFAIPAVIDPRKSQPGVGAPYIGRGIFDVKDVDILLEDGSIVSSKSYTLGIKLSEYVIPPVKGDWVKIEGGTYWIDQVRPDGQGGARWVLKAQQP